MAKKKPSPKPTATPKPKKAKAVEAEPPLGECGLTRSELERLKSNLIFTTQNVYQVAERLFGQTFGEEIFEDLAEHCGLRKCELCYRWKDDPEFEDEYEESVVCMECASWDVADDADDED